MLRGGRPSTLSLARIRGEFYALQVKFISGCYKYTSSVNVSVFPKYIDIVVRKEDFRITIM